MTKITRNYLPELVALSIRRARPSMVTVNLTKRCNQQCIYCEIGKTPPSETIDRLTFEDLCWIIDQMHEARISRISLCGGEPFLFDGLINVIAYAGKKNISCSVTTNGMTVYRLGEEDLRTLKECKTEINISIDSFRDETDSYTRGTSAALPNALRSIQKISEWGIPITLLTVISKYNCHQLSEFLVTAYEKGIEQVLFQPVIYYSNYPDTLPVMDKVKINVSIDKLEMLMEELRKILRFERKHPIKTNVYRIYPWIRQYLETAATQDSNLFFKKVLHKFYCREIYAIIDISYDGGIQPCGLTKALMTIYENRELGLTGIWAEATEGIIADLSQGRYYEYCNGCCHHFSRNMLASIIKYPVQNRAALMKMVPLIWHRILSGMLKRLTLPISHKQYENSTGHRG